MASVFWNPSGILFIDFIRKKGKKVNSDYYCALLDRLKAEMTRKRPYLLNKSIFLQDKAPPHKSSKTMAKINELPFELLSHPLYSLDLAPSNFYLFRNL